MRERKKPALPFTLFLGGDAILAAPWSHVQTPAFLDLVGHMRAADATILNLETVIHSFRGWAQADSGGTWCASPPAIARELAWAGVDMVGHANNHAFDYGSEGVLETIEHISAAGIALSGSGPDLQSATRAAVVETASGKVAHVSMTATFVPYGRASPSRPDLRGRPGVNALASIDYRAIGIPRTWATALERLDVWLGRDARRYRQPRFRRFGRQFEVADSFAMYRRGSRLNAADRARNLAAIAAASAAADLTVVSIHAHDAGAWRGPFVRDAIAAGADVVLFHGPHEVRGIERAGGRPVFHGLGDFAYQAPQFRVQPPEAYARAGVPVDAPFEEIAQRSRLATQRSTYEGCAAVLHWRPDSAPSIRLIPLDLQFHATDLDRGRPQRAARSLGQSIVAAMARQSRPYGVTIRYDDGDGCGVVE